MLNKMRTLLWPLAFLYGLGLRIRHFLFDIEVFKSKKGELPTLVIGNLHVGGTGKTPHAEYFIRKFSNKNMALLSRGYGRKTRGFLLADALSDASQIGDEPMQIHSKFPDLVLAVCEDRLTGIRELKNRTTAEWVILDDAFQHRKLIPDFSIVLMPFQHPWWTDMLLPAGNLRDITAAAKRADVIVVTKCPDNLEVQQINRFVKKTYKSDNQIIAFSKIEYGEPIQIWGNPLNISKSTKVFGFAALANSTDFQLKIQNDFDLIGFRKFADHHIFSRIEIESLRNECGNFAGALPVMITTEKDAVKLLMLDLPKDIHIFTLPIEMKWIHGENEVLSAIEMRIGKI